MHSSRSLPLFFFWAGLLFHGVRAVVVPFLEPGFFFDFNPPETSVPIPVTQQCETIHIKWGRSAAIGPNPVAPYSLQIYTSTFTAPILMDAGSGLSFDWDVPFAPGTQYQICMFDKNGVPGGCQDMYTVIPNTTVATPSCQNVTFPPAMEVNGTVKGGGPISQYGFVDQCTDISIKPTTGKPPFTLTIAPPLHPPFNITSNSMAAITWTVSLSRAMPFFMSLVSSDGIVWANGPMHSGGFGPTDCLAPGTISRKRAHNIAAGAGVGGLFGGLFLAGVALLVQTYLDRRRKRFEADPFENITSIAPSTYGGSDMRTNTESIQTRPSLRVASLDRMLPALPSADLPSGTLMHSGSAQSANSGRSQVYLLHQDAGRAPVAVITEQDTDVIELPPTYNRPSPTESPSPSSYSSASSSRRRNEKSPVV